MTTMQAIGALLVVVPTILFLCFALVGFVLTIFEDPNPYVIILGLFFFSIITGFIILGLSK